MAVLPRARASRRMTAAWPRRGADAERAGRPMTIRPRLGQASFRLAVIDAYGGQCAVTTEHSLPVSRPLTSDLGQQAVPTRSRTAFPSAGPSPPVRPGLRDGSSRPPLRGQPSPEDEYANGRVYYEYDGRPIHVPHDPAARPTSSSWPGTRPRSSRPVALCRRRATNRARDLSRSLAAVRRVLRDADEVCSESHSFSSGAQPARIAAAYRRRRPADHHYRIRVDDQPGLAAAQNGGLDVRVLNPSRGTFHRSSYLARHGDHIMAAVDRRT